MTFFGGDHSKSHYHAGLPCVDHRDKEQSALKRANFKTLIDAGFRDLPYRHYLNGDAEAKAKALKMAEADAAKVLKVTGIKLEVNEGSFF